MFSTSEVTNELIKTVTKDDNNTQTPVAEVKEVVQTTIAQPSDNKNPSNIPNSREPTIASEPITNEQTVVSSLPIPSAVSDEQYFLFATYQLNNQLNKELVTQDKKIIDEILNDPTKKFVLLINILKLQDKLLIVNNHFMLFQASNQFNADDFNKLASQQELLSEIKLAFGDGYYFHAIAKASIKTLAQYSKTNKIDLATYDADIKALEHLDPNALDIKA